MTKIGKAILLLLLLSVGGCSVFYRDCSKLTGEVVTLQCLASQGSEQAQYELGRVAYQAEDYKTALKWLKLAAAVKPARTAIYVPPVGGQTYGSVMMMDTATGSNGHPGAQSLLALMYDKGLGVEIDHKTASRYRKMAGKPIIEIEE